MYGVGWLVASHRNEVEFAGAIPIYRENGGQKTISSSEVILTSEVSLPKQH
jgi:hypothetical protein